MSNSADAKLATDSRDASFEANSIYSVSAALWDWFNMLDLYIFIIMIYRKLGIFFRRHGFCYLKFYIKNIYFKVNIFLVVFLRISDD